jgi:hypothetical protein
MKNIKIIIKEAHDSDVRDKELDAIDVDTTKDEKELAQMKKIGIKTNSDLKKAANNKQFIKALDQQNAELANSILKKANKLMGSGTDSKSHNVPIDRGGTKKNPSLRDILIHKDYKHVPHAAIEDIINDIQDQLTTNRIQIQEITNPDDELEKFEKIIQALKKQKETGKLNSRQEKAIAMLIKQFSEKIEPLVPAADSFSKEVPKPVRLPKGASRKVGTINVREVVKLNLAKHGLDLSKPPNDKIYGALTVEIIRFLKKYIDEDRIGLAENNIRIRLIKNEQNA